MFKTPDFSDCFLKFQSIVRGPSNDFWILLGHWNSSQLQGGSDDQIGWRIFSSLVVALVAVNRSLQTGLTLIFGCHCLKSLMYLR